MGRRVSDASVAGLGLDEAVVQVDNVPPTAAIDSLDGGTRPGTIDAATSTVAASNVYAIGGNFDV